MVHLFVLCALMGTPDSTAPSADQTPPASLSEDQLAADAPRPYFSIQKELRHLLRQESQASDPEQWKELVIQLVTLYGEIVRDERLPNSPTLTSYRVQLRSRLLKTQKRLEQAAARDERGEEGSSNVASDDKESGSSGPSTAPTGRPQAAPQIGGPWGGAARADDGDALVELIQRTISPEFWDVHGGPGTIVYYRQWQALVVRATGDVHQRIGGVVGDLRK